MPVIETIDLTKRYRLKGLRKITAVDGISFQVERGQVFGFLGPNGSGKTTTIGMLLGIITPTAGEVRLLGRGGARGLHGGCGARIARATRPAPRCEVRWKRRCRVRDSGPPSRLLQGSPVTCRAK